MTKRAFTLIELLIVVAIIGILAAIAVPNFGKARQRALISRGVADMRAVITGYRMYFMDGINGWPAHSDMPDAMNPLTTPIAYLSGPIYDVFTVNRPESHGLPYRRMMHGGLPHFEFDCGWFKASDGAKHYAKYRTEDRVLFLHGPGGGGSPYSPSNGTFSNGILVFMMEKDGKPQWGDNLGSLLP